MTYREHPSKAVRLVSGALVGYPQAAESDCTLWVALGDAPDEWEGVLGKWLSEDVAEVVAVPMYAYDLALGDVVRVTRSAEGAPVVSGIVRASGNFTFRVLIDSAAFPGEHWKRLMTELEPFDCWFDTMSERLSAVSVHSAHAQQVADYLQARESASELKYETGRSN